METIAASIVVILYIVSLAYIDAEHINDNDFIENHNSRTVMRLLFGVILLFVAPKVAFFYGFAFVALFDITLNYFRGLDLLYLGKVAKWDIYLRDRKVLHITIKVISTILAILVLFY